MTFRSDKKNVQAVYLDEIISVDKDGNNLSLYEVLKDDSRAVDEEVENKIIYKKIEKIINSHLNLREQEIIKKRYGLCGFDMKTQIELAEELNISRSYISRLEKKAINLIRNVLKCNKI